MKYVKLFEEDAKNNMFGVERIRTYHSGAKSVSYVSKVIYHDNNGNPDKTRINLVKLEDDPIEAEMMSEIEAEIVKNKLTLKKAKSVLGGMVEYKVTDLSRLRGTIASKKFNF